VLFAGREPTSLPNASARSHKVFVDNDMSALDRQVPNERAIVALLAAVHDGLPILGRRLVNAGWSGMQRGRSVRLRQFWAFGHVRASRMNLD
jgi:hypothetical protein